MPFFKKTPSQRKVDLGPRTRGFANLLGKRIVAIDASAVNVIILVDENGERWEISAETGIGAIPVVSCQVVTGS